MAVNRDYRHAIERMLAAHSVPYTIRYGRHTLAEYMGKDGKRHVATLSVTNASARSVRNAESDLRRQLIEAGYIEPKPKPKPVADLEPEIETVSAKPSDQAWRHKRRELRNERRRARRTQ